jgi:hypothetical protein
MWSDDLIVHSTKIRGIQARIGEWDPQIGETANNIHDFDEIEVKVFRKPVEYRVGVDGLTEGRREIGGASRYDTFDDAFFAAAESHQAILDGTTTIRSASHVGRNLPARTSWEIAFSKAKDFVLTTEFKVAFVSGLVIGLFIGKVLSQF